MKTSPRWIPPDWIDDDVLRAATELQFDDGIFIFCGMSGGAALDVDDTQGTQEEFMGSN